MCRIISPDPVFICLKLVFTRLRGGTIPDAFLLGCLLSGNDEKRSCIYQGDSADFYFLVSVTSLNWPKRWGRKINFKTRRTE